MNGSVLCAVCLTAPADLLYLEDDKSNLVVLTLV
jgi:hypothetical protein